MSWGRNKNPKDILKNGEEIEVSIKELDKENKRFKLAYTKKGPDPWKKVEEKYQSNIKSLSLKISELFNKIR